MRVDVRVGVGMNALCAMEAKPVVPGFRCPRSAAGGIGGRGLAALFEASAVSRFESIAQPDDRYLVEVQTIRVLRRQRFDAQRDAGDAGEECVIPVHRCSVVVVDVHMNALFAREAKSKGFFLEDFCYPRRAT
jgi:hypothetical protein